MDVCLDKHDSLTSFVLPAVMPSSGMNSPMYFATFVTVVRTNTKTLSVDVIVGKPSDDVAPLEFKDVPVIIPGGAGSHVRIELPKKDDICLMLFINGNVEYRAVLGTMFIQSDKDQNTLTRTIENSEVAEGDDIYVHESGAITIYKKDGTIKIISVAGGDKNITVKPNGEVVINGGTKGVARKDDAVSVSMQALDVVALATVLLTTGAFLPTGSPPITPVVGVPISLSGSITAGSATVKVGE